MFLIGRILFSLLCLTLTLSIAHSSSGESIEVTEKQGATLENIIPILPDFFREKADTDIDVFTSRYISLSNTGYVPPDLVPLEDLAYVDEAGRKSKLRRVAHDALDDLSKAFEKQFSVPLVVVSGYRSAEYQQRLWDLGKCNATLCAPPGYSEHQLGLAIDIFDASTETEYYKNAKYRRYIAWLRDHAHEYGWHQSYQKGEYVDGYEVEPWHWRYLGIPLATRLKKLDMSYTQYIRLNRILSFWKR